MWDLFIWIYSGGGGREFHETFWGGGDEGYRSLGTSGLGTEPQNDDSFHSRTERET
jgi:hypothetical protein